MTALVNTSITSTTVEDALLEILRRVADLQASAATNPNNRTVITTFTQNELTGVYTVGLTIPSAVTMGADGIVSNATELFT
ncbi:MULTISPECIES: hypothetical protein [unclassified Microcoleus]|uniref:hypothetical protein n=1 Tax=unclassified Microcoleus TaxID=2642155 RepID=UPI002FD1C954